MTAENGITRFNLVSTYPPAGDQPEAIAALSRGLRAGARRLTLEGVTGSGKTFTMANLIREWGRPTLILSHNKTLAAQLFAELKGFFPDHAVEYFVSYYDYYQPEAYIPQTDTYIEKDASINEEIERYRLGATNALLGRRDVVIVASVSCIYGLGSPEDYREMLVDLAPGLSAARDAMLAQLVGIQYVRNDYEPKPGTFRVRGDSVDIFPSYENDGVRVTFFGDEVEALHTLDPVTGRTRGPLSRAVISPAKHFVMPRAKIDAAIGRIESELAARLAELERQGKLLEAQRLRQRTDFDVEMLRELGYCNGIENYSRHLAGRAAGEPPACLLDYFEGEFLTILDESHVTLPQLRAMYNGDQARKQTLVEHGFRLPSAKDNRPLRFEEFLDKVGPVVFASATPGPYERQVSEVTVEQVIRPTGLLDPPVEIRPLGNQIDDLIEEIRCAAEQGDRALVTTLTKRSAEDLTAYLTEIGIRVEYLHSDIGAIERVAVLGRLRTGAFDCLIGINLLREGLDLPEVALVAVLDADKEGFLRSATSLIQTAGRTARHVNGRVILYADHETEAIRRMIEITRTRRQRQEDFNAAHGVTPQSVRRAINESLDLYAQAQHIEERMSAAESSEAYDLCRAIADTEAEMIAAAEALEFERAALLRDDLRELKRLLAAPDAKPTEDGVKTAKSSGKRAPRRNVLPTFVRLR
ncbi:MAG: excinuclease ABC subunit UvrB [Kiritimatiellia bacterium]|jgi:excinuclease ABC subunit B|nr:excinuclease ABC subunit UvrB [Kiritimatiellia bacterium]